MFDETNIEILFLKLLKKALIALSNPGSMTFVYVLGQSPSDWKTTTNQNAVPTIFHTQQICHHVWKIVRTTLQCIIVLQLWGEGHPK